MTAATTSAPVTTRPGAPKPKTRTSVAGPLSQHHFVLRRLHSLSGIVPVGLFVIGHLFTNAQMIWQDNGETFQHEVEFIHSIPALLFIEIALWSAIAFHAGLGLYYTFSGKGNVAAYSYGDNIRYSLQRWTGVIALVFIFFHIATLRWRWDILGLWDTPFYYKGYSVPGMEEQFPALANVPLSAPLTAYALQYSVWVALLYLVGVVAVVFHWSNGLWTAAISWGLTISTGAMKKWGYVCIGLFVALMVFFGAAFVGSLRYDFDAMTPQQKAATLFTVGDGQWAFDDKERLETDLASIGMEAVLLPPEDADETGAAGDERPIVEPSETPGVADDAADHGGDAAH